MSERLSACKAFVHPRGKPARTTFVRLSLLQLRALPRCSRVVRGRGRGERGSADANADVATVAVSAAGAALAGAGSAVLASVGAGAWAGAVADGGGVFVAVGAEATTSSAVTLSASNIFYEAHRDVSTTAGMPL